MNTSTLKFVERPEWIDVLVTSPMGIALAFFIVVGLGLLASYKG